MKKTTARLAAVLLIILSAVFLIKSELICKQYRTAKHLKAVAMQRNLILKRRIKAVQKISIPKTVFGYHNIKTFLLTFLSFSDYVKYKGFNDSVFIYKAVSSLKQPAEAHTPHAFVKVKTANINGIPVLSSYISNSRSFYGLKKISLKFDIENFHSANEVLKIISDIQNLFPSRINLIKMTDREAVINFNIYGG